MADDTRSVTNYPEIIKVIIGCLIMKFTSSEVTFWPNLVSLAKHIFLTISFWYLSELCADVRFMGHPVLLYVTLCLSALFWYCRWHVAARKHAATCNCGWSPGSGLCRCCCSGILDLAIVWGPTVSSCGHLRPHLYDGLRWDRRRP
jgi:hypothetical protein